MLCAAKDEYPVLLSNGDLVEEGPDPENPRHHCAVFRDPHKKPSYLFALVAGDLHSVETTIVTKVWLSLQRTCGPQLSPSRQTATRTWRSPCYIVGVGFVKFRAEGWCCTTQVHLSSSLFVFSGGHCGAKKNRSRKALRLSRPRISTGWFRATVVFSWHELWLLCSPISSRQSGRSVRVAVWGVSRNRGKLGWALESAVKSMRWDEEAFGREYDLNAFHVACVDGFNAGAMENKGLNIFNCDALLAEPKSTTGKDCLHWMADARSAPLRSSPFIEFCFC